MFLYEALE